MTAARKRPVPPWSILDRTKPYVNAASTDVRRTFDRVRAQQAQLKTTLPWRKP